MRTEGPDHFKSSPVVVDATAMSKPVTVCRPVLVEGLCTVHATSLDQDPAFYNDTPCHLAYIRMLANRNMSSNQKPQYYKY